MSQVINESKKSLFIGGALIDSQLLFIIPLAHGYCTVKGISRLVFERRIPNKIWKQEAYKIILSSYEISYLDGNRLGRFLYPFRKTLEALWLFADALTLASKTTEKTLLLSGTWFEKQLRHAVWDEARRAAPDGRIQLSFWRKWIAALRVLVSAENAKKLITKHQVSTAFLGHTVYTSRSLLAEFRRNKVEVFAHANFVLYRLPAESDLSWDILSRSEWEQVLSVVDQPTSVSNWYYQTVFEQNQEDRINRDFNRE